MLCVEAFKDFLVPCGVEDFEPTEEMMSFWARPSIARTQDVEISQIEELYGREGDADSEVEEDLIQPTPVFKTMQQPKKDTPIPSGGFQYDVDAALPASMQDGTMHEWVLCELKAVCRRYGLFGGARQMCWRVLSATLQASKWYSLLCTRLRLITTLVCMNNLKLFRVGLHVWAMDCKGGME